jgi:N-acetylglutamate synthase/N-acetylornithine aminotransferase
LVKASIVGLDLNWEQMTDAVHRAGVSFNMTMMSVRLGPHMRAFRRSLKRRGMYFAEFDLPNDQTEIMMLLKLPPQLVSQILISGS